MFLDIFVLVVVVISALIGMLRGFVREVMTLVGVAAGLGLSWIAAPIISPVVAKWLGAPDSVPEGQPIPKLLDVVPYDLAATAISWCAIIILTIIIVSIISHILAEAAKSSGLGMADSSIGAIFGIARGLVIVAVLYLPVAVLADTKLKEKWLAGGLTYSVLESVSEKVTPLLPGLNSGEDGDEEEKPKTEDGESKDSTIDSSTKIAPLGYANETRKSMDKLIEIQGQINEGE